MIRTAGSVTLVRRSARAVSATVFRASTTVYALMTARTQSATRATAPMGSKATIVRLTLTNALRGLANRHIRRRARLLTQTRTPAHAWRATPALTVHLISTSVYLTRAATESVSRAPQLTRMSATATRAGRVKIAQQLWTSAAQGRVSTAATALTEPTPTPAPVGPATVA